MYGKHDTANVLHHFLSDLTGSSSPDTDGGLGLEALNISEHNCNALYTKTLVLLSIVPKNTQKSTSII